MDMDGHRVGGHRWVDLGWVGWTSDGCRSVVSLSLPAATGSDAVLSVMRDKQAKMLDHMGKLLQTHTSFHVPCPHPPMSRPQTAATSVRSLSVVVALNK